MFVIVYSFVFSMINFDLQSTLRESRTKSLVGTPAYVAPEIFLQMPYDGKVYIIGFSVFEITSNKALNYLQSKYCNCIMVALPR